MYDWKGFKGVVVVQRVQIIEPKCWIHTCTYHAHGLRTLRGVQVVITTPMSHSSCFENFVKKLSQVIIVCSNMYYVITKCAFLIHLVNFL